MIELRISRNRKLHSASEIEVGAAIMDLVSEYRYNWGASLECILGKRIRGHPIAFCPAPVPLLPHNLHLSLSLSALKLIK